MTQTQPYPQRRSREDTRRLLKEFFKHHDGSWKSDAKYAFRSFFAPDLKPHAMPPKQVVDKAERLLANIEAAAAHIGCSLGGLWLAGVHFVPGNELVRGIHPEGFVLFESRGGFSPLVVGPQDLLLQGPQGPVVSGYTLATDLRPVFEKCISPASFF